MCSTKTAHPLSHSCLGLTIIIFIYIHIFFFAITSKGTIMEIRSTRSFNAIPATLIKGVFNLYVNLLYKVYCKYFIYSSICLFILLFALYFSFNHCNFLFICGKFILTYLLIAVTLLTYFFLSGFKINSLSLAGFYNFLSTYWFILVVVLLHKLTISFLQITMFLFRLCC